jgi:hypothetical protein
LGFFNDYNEPPFGQEELSRFEPKGKLAKFFRKSAFGEQVSNYFSVTAILFFVCSYAAV